MPKNCENGRGGQHQFYTNKDFFPEEIKSRNIIAVSVKEEGAKICKICGWSDHSFQHYMRLEKSKKGMK